VSYRTVLRFTLVPRSEASPPLSPCVHPRELPAADCWRRSVRGLCSAGVDHWECVTSLVLCGVTGRERLRRAVEPQLAKAVDVGKSRH